MIERRVVRPSHDAYTRLPCCRMAIERFAPLHCSPTRAKVRPKIMLLTEH